MKRQNMHGLPGCNLDSQQPHDRGEVHKALNHRAKAFRITTNNVPNSSAILHRKNLLFRKAFGQMDKITQYQISHPSQW